jgi:hypothetical protein
MRPTRLPIVDLSRQYSRVPSSRGGGCISAAVLAAITGLSFHANARELLPFPSQQQLQPSAQQPVPGSYYLTDFKRLIENMTCEQLEALRSKLANSKSSAAAPADQEYYGNLIGLVDQRRSQRNCLSK